METLLTKVISDTEGWDKEEEQIKGRALCNARKTNSFKKQQSFTCVRTHKMRFKYLKQKTTELKEKIDAQWSGRFYWSSLSN